MGLASHGVAFLLGYVLGRPDSRQQIVELRQQLTELAHKPEVKRLGERGRELVGEGAQAARSAVSAKLGGDRRPSDAAAPPEPDTGSTVSAGSSAAGSSAGPRATDQATPPAGPDTAPDESTGSDVGGPAPTGFGGTTSAEDTQAVITGIPAPPPAGRTNPPRSADSG